MNIVLVVVLVALFGYALALVLANNSVAEVNLLFSQVPAMNLGFLLIVSLFLGLLIGMLMALVVFKVLPMRFEIRRLKKEQGTLQNELDASKARLAHYEKTVVIDKGDVL